MSGMFQASVIIPVYNAEKFIRQAVESAVNLPEVGEIILIEDKSPDNALEICRQLHQKYPKVKLFQHPNGENRGAGASRNLGIINSKFDYIAFLDADDYFLPNRFEKAAEIFNNDSSVDGVYEPVGVHFYSEGGKRQFLQLKQLDEQSVSRYLTNFRKPVKPEEVLYNLITPVNGAFCTDGIIIKKSILTKSGIFNEGLRLHQDSELWIRIAYHGRLVAGETKVPIAMRGVHAQNRITSTRGRTNFYLYRKAMYDYFIKGRLQLPFGLKWRIIRSYVSVHPIAEKSRKQSILVRKLKIGWLMLSLLAAHDPNPQA